MNINLYGVFLILKKQIHHHAAETDTKVEKYLVGYNIKR